jgi:cell division protein ZapD
MSSPILYEQPLSERLRIFLRLEHFFSSLNHFQQGSFSPDTQAGISTLIEILAILERSDVRSEIIKELERQIAGLSKLLDTREVDKCRLDAILEKLSASSQALQKSPSKLSFDMRENELLNSVRHRNGIAAGTCGFDLPAYHYLLNQPSSIRFEVLSRWTIEFNPLKDSLHLLLSLLRNSSLFERQEAESGFYQKSLDTQNPCQLLRILMPEGDVYPEVSGSKHRVNIRFLQFSETGRPKQINHNQIFDISYCTI